MSHCLAALRAMTVLLVLTVVGTAPGPIASAQASPRLTFTDETGQATTTYHRTIEPGAQDTIPVRVTAASTAALDVEIALVNVTSPPNGGLAFVTTPPATAPVTWLQIEDGTASIEPGAGLNRPIRVTVPTGAKPGTYTAALTVTTTEPTPIEGSSIGQRTRATALVAITVPGTPTATFTVGTPTRIDGPHGTDLQVPIENTGTVPLTPTGSLTLADSAPIEVTMGTLYPGAKTTLTIPIGATEAQSATLSLTDSATRATASLPTIDLGTDVASTDPGTAPEEITSDLVSFQNITIEPSGANLTVALEVANYGSPIRNATITLELTADGAPLEDAVIAEGVSLVDGTTSFATEVTPATSTALGDGTWTARLRLETLDDTGQLTTIIRTAPLDITTP
jgi:hypothetical protein